MQRGVLVVNGEPCSVNVARCTTFIERARGLLGRPDLGASEALWISPCASVHTFGMRYSIDVIFCDFDGTVIRVVEHLEPGRIAVAAGARTACELHAGVVQRLGIAEKDQLSFALTSGGR
jgi:uncharacterized membrane protein (UPF0127 family)